MEREKYETIVKWKKCDREKVREKRGREKIVRAKKCERREREREN